MSGTVANKELFDIWEGAKPWDTVFVPFPFSGIYNLGSKRYNNVNENPEAMGGRSR